jgi:hypothetical protein
VLSKQFPADQKETFSSSLLMFKFNNVKKGDCYRYLKLYHPYVGIARIRLRGYHLSRQLTAPLDNFGGKITKNRAKNQRKFCFSFIYYIAVSKNYRTFAWTIQHKKERNYEEFGGSCAHNSLQHEYVNLLQDQDCGRFASGK